MKTHRDEEDRCEEATRQSRHLLFDTVVAGFVDHLGVEEHAGHERADDRVQFKELGQHRVGERSNQ